MADSEDLMPPAPDGPGLFGDAPAATPAVQPYRVLARKYRPTSFDDLIGQGAMVRILRRAFALNRIAHAFMLTGVRGVGKTTTARIIARALNCIGPDGKNGPTADPCGVCENCRGILADRHPDVVEMDAASRTGVDDVREIIEATRFRPMQARTKVFIVDEVHMLSRNAFNALLKTLEEPPPHIKFVFATTEIRKVPVTVLSRCQRFDLRRIPVAMLAAHYAGIATREGVAIDAEAVAAIARAADGSVRDGLSLLDQAIAQGSLPEEGGGAPAPIGAAVVAGMLGLAGREVVFDLMEAVASGRTEDALAITDRAYTLGADLGALLGDLLDLTHTLSRLKAVPALRQSKDLPEAERTRGAALADALTVPVLARFWQMLLKGLQEIELAPNRRAAAEMVLIRLCHVSELPTPGDLARRFHAGERSAGANPPSAGLGNGTSSGATRSAVPPHDYATATTRPGAVAYSEADGARLGAARAAMRMTAVTVATPQADFDNAAALLTAASRPGEEPAKVEADAVLIRNFRDVVALAAAEREGTLHGHLIHSVHLIRFAPPVIEVRPQPAAPRDLAPRLAALLHRVTGTRWTIALGTGVGDPSLAEQGEAADRGRRHEAFEHPLVQAILAAWPGARIESVRAPGLDEHGLAAPILPDAVLGDAAEPAPAEIEDGLAPPPDFDDVPLEMEDRFLTETLR